MFLSIVIKFDNFIMFQLDMIAMWSIFITGRSPLLYWLYKDT